MIKGEIMFDYIITFLVTEFFWKHENLGRSDDPKQSKIRGPWPYYNLGCWAGSYRILKDIAKIILHHKNFQILKDSGSGVTFLTHYYYQNRFNQNVLSQQSEKN